MTVRKSRSIRILPRKVTVAEENSGERDGRNHPTRLSIYPHFALSDVTRQRPCIFCALLTVTLRGHMEQWMAARRAISGCKSIFGDFEEGALTPTAYLRVDDSASLSYQRCPSICLSLTGSCTARQPHAKLRTPGGMRCDTCGGGLLSRHHNSQNAHPTSPGKKVDILLFPYVQILTLICLATFPHPPPSQVCSCCQVNILLASTSHSCVEKLHTTHQFLALAVRQQFRDILPDVTHGLSVRTTNTLVRILISHLVYTLLMTP